ncbi:GNAT family N-acetyltransferase [Brachybacterium sacelli]|uniref:GNAT superfamily N-acetyltransferase n=1 Tax=Brachybacterium sacelli TaxID=173364 RepID=A0ABS4X5R2_9MICO|nr:GNAT family N-acetyltransferase [Brachybacterium sacelli]MBP2383809.1 GNAT superfamily N-acetyltransferase [Brachybacterium sacelli]
MNDVGIARVKNGEVEAEDVARLIATAFNALDVAVWLVPDPGERLEAMSSQFAILVAHALEHGRLDMTTDGHGVAVWFDLTVPLPEPPRYAQRLRRACGAHIAHFEMLDEAFARHHPEAPHHHLAFLAVRAGHQGRGRGTALLEHHHRVLDEEGVPGYLEASSHANRELYARLGYTELGSPLTLPEGPHMWPMWRPPAG